ARAGLRDSAHRVLSRITADSSVDPTGEVAFIKAFAYSQLGDREVAIAQLQISFAASPERKAALVEDPGWWFQSIANDSAFRRVVGGQ
ncbi:MAG TPA: hypothetical protein VLA89_03095, partial [Gemmatimonadales bacterium]|nr:hypothetical protein [Gemmatimonadales bacterium]